AAVQLHVDFALQDDAVIDRVRAMHAGAGARLQLSDPEHATALDGQGHFTLAAVAGVDVVRRTAVRRPDQGESLALGHLVDGHDRLPVRIVAGDHAPYSRWSHADLRMWRGSGQAPEPRIRVLDGIYASGALDGSRKIVAGLTLPVRPEPPWYTWRLRITGHAMLKPDAPPNRG